MGQDKTARNTVPTTVGSIQSGGATATAPRPGSTKRTPNAKAGKGPAITHDQIARRAHEIWVTKGCKPGQEQHNWLEAERQLKAELARK
jgi:hypothetical protein